MLLSASAKVYQGAVAADKVYQGDTLVWSRVWTPAAITGLGLWLEADQITGVVDGGQITTWPDRGPRHYDVAPSPGAPAWRRSAMSGRPAVAFDTTHRLLIRGWGNELSGKSEYTLFHAISAQMTGYPIVLTAPTYSLWQFLTEYDSSRDFYWGHPNGTYNLFDANIVPGQNYVLSMAHSLSSSKFYRDGTQLAAVGGSGISQTIPNVGGDVYVGQYYDGSLGLVGNIGAILWYDRFLIDSERVQVENYLKSKYGIA